MVRSLSGPKNNFRSSFFCHRESHVGSIGKLTASFMWPALNSHSWRVSTIKRFCPTVLYRFQRFSVVISRYPPLFASDTTSLQVDSFGVTARLVNHKAPMVINMAARARLFFFISFNLIPFILGSFARLFHDAGLPKPTVRCLAAVRRRS